ncbi:hypothetical protein FCV25MIE_26112 [Fagus crenata]
MELLTCQNPFAEEERRNPLRPLLLQQQFLLHQRKPSVLERSKSKTPQSKPKTETHIQNSTKSKTMTTPLICCFAGARKEFVPTVGLSDNQMDLDMYSKSRSGRCSSGTRLSFENSKCYLARVAWRVCDVRGKSWEG